MKRNFFLVWCIQKFVWHHLFYNLNVALLFAIKHILNLREIERENFLFAFKFELMCNSRVPVLLYSRNIPSNGGTQNCSWIFCFFTHAPCGAWVFTPETVGRGSVLLKHLFLLFCIFSSLTHSLQWQCYMWITTVLSLLAVIIITDTGLVLALTPSVPKFQCAFPPARRHLIYYYFLFPFPFSLATFVNHHMGHSPQNGNGVPRVTLFWNILKYLYFRAKSYIFY